MVDYVQIWFLLPIMQGSPLNCAASGGHVDTVQYLIEAGADLNMKDNDGVSE